jgi:hypothetical protein
MIGIVANGIFGARKARNTTTTPEKGELEYFSHSHDYLLRSSCA